MRLATLVAVAAMASGVGCGSAKAGDACEDPECENSSTAFVCENGIYRSVPCRGPQGCSTSSPGDVVEIICDETGDVAGDNCDATSVGFVVCGNAPNALECTGGEQWTAETCPTMCTPGPSGTGACE
jgi:hypothetical protein